jgi:hypothetical protein
MDKVSTLVGMIILFLVVMFLSVFHPFSRRGMVVERTP